MGWYLDSANSGEPRLKLVNLAEIRMFSEVPESVVETEITVRIQGQEPIALDTRQLGTLSIYVPGQKNGNRGQNRRQRGWKLLDVLGLVTKPDAISTVTVRGTDGELHTFTATEVSRDSGMHITVKRNKRGLLMVRWLGEDGKREQVRGLTHVDLVREVP